jgi:quercetin dioxygenase-like cupin family protein
MTRYRQPVHLLGLFCTAAFAASSLVGFATAAYGQASAIHKTTLQSQMFPPPRYQTVTIRTVVDPKGEVPRHVHPGVEMGYVLSGETELDVQGKAPQHLSANGSFSIPPYTAHRMVNTGVGPLIMLSTYVVDKNKPIMIPVH